MNKIFTFFRESSMGRFFIPLGIILIVFSYFSYIAVNNSKDYIKLEATVSKLELFQEAYTDENYDYYDATYTTYVRYNVDNVEYEEEYGVFSNYKIGDKVTISYNPANPKEIAQPNSIFLPIGIFILGVASLTVGIISIIKAIKRNRALKLQEEEWNNGN